MLASIVESKRRELEEVRSRHRQLLAALETVSAPRGFAAALAAPDHVSLIAECKRRSPGVGPIRPGLDPAELARGYEAAGAACMSVLTDRAFFGGSNDDLVAVRSAVALPVLRKDFILDPLHVIEARAVGADAVLLIARILGDAELSALSAEAVGLGMDVLVEVHDADELRRALELEATFVGINNRDLATFTTDLGTTIGLLDALPDDTVVVSESGIRNAGDVERLGAAGVDAILVGETLLKADDPGAKAAELARVPRVARTRG